MLGRVVIVDIFAILVIFIQVSLLLLAINVFTKKPFDVGTLFVFLFIFFYAIPAWDFYFNGELFLKEILDYHVGYKNESIGLYLIFITTLIMLSFYIGYLFMMKLLGKKDRINNKYNIVYKNYNIVATSLMFFWLGIFLYSLSKYDQSLWLFFSPSRKEGVFESEYISTLYLLIPLTLFILKVLKDFIEVEKVRLTTLYLILPILLIYMTSGQRREIINLIIFIFVFLTHIGIEKIKKRKKLNETSYKRSRILQLGVLSILLIPILWWARVLSTQLQRNDLNIIMPWQRRGFMELLFGSSSGGFKTLLLGLEHKEIFGLPWGYSIYFFFTSIVPRSIMEDKPIIINKLWERDFYLKGNPSTFYINEMYINFGVSSIFFSGIFGLVFSYFYNKLYNSRSIIRNVFAFLIFSNVILLFKNGFTQFFIIMLMTLTVVGFSCKSIIRKV
ncbi:oligosaccharide repeat unit polymerase [Bacillus sp. CH30_1T]|uniref:O-antigen polymerase n=1 Tax=Bacillus sp. CH30_1T TaxID=2604836 RepID=UPI0011EDF883|nr:O-antigen polymerase [Bacillus sp. CH30_1T]KAA0565838.1 oligosaccharide repeat unit polymerase [Bacillus sp. CH30_1T]